MNISHNNSNISLNTSAVAPPSPWESRRMKADLIEAKSRVSRMEKILNCKIYKNRRHLSLSDFKIQTRSGSFAQIASGV